MAWKFNPFTGTLDIDRAGNGSSYVFPVEFSNRLTLILSSLASFDRVAEISYFDQGLRTERIDQIIYSSSTYPDSNVTKSVSYSDVGTMNQRIDKVEYTGGILDTQTLTLTYQYEQHGLRFIKTGYNFDLA